MFTSLDSRQHSHRRARISSIYSKTFMKSSRHYKNILKSILLQRLVPTVDRASQTKTGSLDVLPLLHAYPLDFMSAFVFGLSESHNLIEDLEAREVWLETFLIIFHSRAATLLREFKWFTRCATALGFSLLPKGYADARRRTEAWSASKVDRAESRLLELEEAGSEFAEGDLPVLFSAVRDGILQDAGAEKGSELNAGQRQEAASECNDHVGEFIHIQYTALEQRLTWVCLLMI